MDYKALQIHKFIDHTCLKPNATVKEIERLCQEALDNQFYSVCINGLWVPLCNELLFDSSVQVCTVVGFPLGAMASRAKAFEAELAANQGATEIDMVISIGALLAADYESVRQDIRDVVEAVRGHAIVKVILETGYLSDEQKRVACQIAEEAGADYVKTSTGFGPSGASVEDIRLMRAAVFVTTGVKASGGIRDYETAVQMILAGASRLGTSSGTTIMDTLPR
jgi:deoxyribose-phosphate aldolase